MSADDEVRASVSKYYSEAVKTTSDLRTSACCTAKPPPPAVVDILRRIPQEVVSKYYGCGSPFPQGVDGKRILDLGCGTGRDCFVCAALVGPQGSVTGIDMTPSQLEVAQRHEEAWARELGYAKPNTHFLTGTIEDVAAAGIAPSSVDIAISNCVINLSPDKPAVLRSIFNALAPGGEMFFSDVYCSKRLPAELRKHEVLLGECLGGAMYVNDFLEAAQVAGFARPRMLSAERVEVHDPELVALLGPGTCFYSITFRVFKLPDAALEPYPEQYGQLAVYKGSVPGSEASYTLDTNFTFPAGEKVPVDSNTAAVLQSSWLSGHFSLTSPGPHQGQFLGIAQLDASAVEAAMPPRGSTPSTGNSGCCGPANGAAQGTVKGSSCCAPPPEAKASCCGPKAAPPSCCGPK